jgi:hypothetical protein
MGKKKEKNEKDIMIHSWKSRFLSYYEDYTGKDEDLVEMAEMACMLIPSFLHDFGLEELLITRVDYYNYGIDWQGFIKYMNDNHPYLKVKMFEQQIDWIK